MKIVVVSHSHWDREWHRTFQSFRARLVDLIDVVLDRCRVDPRFRFVLDGQTIVLEDYLAVRPGRRDELEAACRSGQLAIGPWYVQPDSLLPSGETHVRNLLEGRRVGEAFGPVSRVAYCPDSFGHPAQFPQLFAGFGLGRFVYWRGNGNEIDRLGAEYLWEGPDGSTVQAHHLAEGYFAASGAPSDAAAAAAWLADLATTLAARSRRKVVLLMNGFDHALPDPHVEGALDALVRTTGWQVSRGLLDDFAALLDDDGERFRGELLGARTSNLLPGVWSSRMPLKLRNRRVETALCAWAEPWAAIGCALGLPDERPSLRIAWRALLQNQAHDSIGGCSIDRVHEQMLARYDEAAELADETTARVLERLAGCDVERRSPWDETFDVAVFNPSPFPRTDLVRFEPRPREWVAFRGEEARAFGLHPWLQIGIASAAYTADGTPARLVEDHATDRIRLLPEIPPRAIEFVVRDVPAFGWRRVRLAPSEAHADVIDEGREIALDDLQVIAADDGTLSLVTPRGRFDGLGAIEDTGDRGDTYDHDPVAGPTPVLEHVHIERTRSPIGVQSLRIERRFGGARGCTIEMESELVPGTGRVDLSVSMLNRAGDHRLRLCFPTGAPVGQFRAATTFDVVTRAAQAPDATGWVHPAPTTFPHQGFVCANGLTVAAPGLPEAEVTRDGVIAITLVRSVGWLARLDVATRPQPAGPVIPVPGAQSLGERIAARLALFPSLEPSQCFAAEAGLRVVVAGPTPKLPADRSAFAVSPRQVILSALKPAVDGEGIVLRLLNPTDEWIQATVHSGLTLVAIEPLRLDESLDGPRTGVDDGTVSVRIGPHALRSLRLITAPPR